MRLAIAVAVFTASACTSPSESGPFEVVFDACEPVNVVPAADATAAELASIDEAVAMWNTTGVVQLRVGETHAAAILPLRFEDAAPVFFGLYDDALGEIVVNRRLGSSRGRTITIAHELGHAFGLRHIQDGLRHSVMNQANLSYAPDATDAAAVQRLWGLCKPSLREAGGFAQQ